MNEHACAVLDAAKAWNWPAPSCLDTPTRASEFKTVCRRLLLCLIMESDRLGGSLVERFWTEVERCHPQFLGNVQELREMDYSSPEDTAHALFFDVDARTVDFGPVFGLAADLFTHIGLAFMNPNVDRHLKFLSPFSQTLSPSTPGQDVGPSRQRDEVLKFLALKRDGTSCPFSEIPYYGLGGVDPVLSHVIPSSIKYKPETLALISDIAGKAAMDSILQYSNTIDNVLATEAKIATSHRLSHWGLEANESPGDVNHSTYHFKTFHVENEFRVGSIFLRDGDEIVFGLGPEGTHLRNGPHPLLCNLRLAVGRALCNSGAADFITRLMEDANDIDCPHHVALDKSFHEVLNAKLLICGRAQMVEPGPPVFVQALSM